MSHIHLVPYYHPHAFRYLQTPHVGSFDDEGRFSPVEPFVVDVRTQEYHLRDMDTVGQDFVKMVRPQV